VNTTIYKVMIDEEDHYPATYREAFRLYKSGEKNERDCRLVRQVWDEDSGDPIEEDVIMSTEEGIG
jgi:hypothetical protein